MPTQTQKQRGKKRQATGLDPSSRPVGQSVTCDITDYVPISNTGAGSSQSHLIDATSKHHVCSASSVFYSTPFWGHTDADLSRGHIDADLSQGHIDADLSLGLIDADLSEGHIYGDLSEGHTDTVCTRIPSVASRRPNWNNFAFPTLVHACSPLPGLTARISHDFGVRPDTAEPGTSSLTRLPALHVSPPLRTRADKCLHIYTAVAASGMPNFSGARIRLPSAFNLPAWRRLLAGYHDAMICDFLEFGWPMNYTRAYPPAPVDKHHASALAFPDHVSDYLETEVSLGAIMGPFPHAPFTPWCQTNAFMTREKKCSAKRRIIVDLSWPTGFSVNSGIPSDIYLGQPYKLHLPTVDDLANAIVKQGQGCFLYSLDLARAYRQLRCDPLDWPLLGYMWNNCYYFDIAIPFGVRWGAMACQRMTNAVCNIVNCDKRTLLGYIDDFAGVAPTLATATLDFKRVRELLQELGVNEAVDKATPPSTTMTWIGVDFDTIALEMRIPEDKLSDTLSLLRKWKHKSRATRRELQQVLGKLFHVSKCCKPARLFVGRMLETLRSAPEHGLTHLSIDFQKDINWFLSFLPTFNGVQLIQPRNDSAQHVAFVDSCLSGCGGYSGSQYYHTEFPDFITSLQLSICQLEMLNIVIAVKLWAATWSNSSVQIYGDNAATVAVLNSGRGRDRFLLQCAREIWLLSATHKFILSAKHVPGKDNVLADSLSRLHLSHGFLHSLEAFDPANELLVDAYLFKLNSQL